MPGPLNALYELDPGLSRADVVGALAAVPGQLAAALDGMTERDLEAAPVPGEWSAFHVLRHMRDAALVYSIRFRWMAFNADPFLPDYDEDRWVALAADTAADLPALLGEFAASRSGLVRLLTRLSPEAWGSTGRHEVLGTVVLEPYVRHQLKHEELHLEQLWAALALAAASSR